MQLTNGSVAPGFETVQAEFVHNFLRRGEVGAACAVYHQREKVVDLWGGLRDKDTGQPWERDTLVPVFSTTKGLASMALAHAHSSGLLDYEERVAAYWEDFAQNGKYTITVRQLLAHQAGLCAVDVPLDYETLTDADRTATTLARQTPAWIPGANHGYHAQTLGLYEAELIRRIDPLHRTLGQYFRDEIALPMELDCYIGLPDDIPASRIATLVGSAPWRLLLNVRKLGWPLLSALLNPSSLTARAFNATTCYKDVASYNQRHLQIIEFPSANGIATARSIAAVYGEFATGGTQLGLKVATTNALSQPAIAPTNAAAFGMPGTGGSFAFADPDKRVGYAYVMNKCGFYPVDDPREKAIRDAVYRCL